MQIAYDLIRWPNAVLEKCEPFLLEVLDQGKHDEHFWMAFQVHWKSILVTLVGLSGAGGFCYPHFNFNWNLNMMQHKMLALSITRTRDVTTHPH